MKTIAKLFPVLAVAVLSISLSSALRADDAPATPPPADAPKADTQLSPRLEQRIKYLDENLKLTSDQKAQVTGILSKAQDQLRGEKAKLDTETRRARRQRFREVMQGAHEQVRALLTPDQQKVFDALPMQGRHGPKGGGQV
ncbi:MAG TPA: hypothetical protein VG710_03635 [Opitutus sp.]|nr:hypothetical protein [Opitutus sp.]